MCCYHSYLPLPFLTTLSSNTPSLLLGRQFIHVKRSTLLKIWPPLQLCSQVRARGYYAKGMRTINKSRTGRCSLLAQLHSQSNNAAVVGGVPVVEHATNMAAKVKGSDLIFLGTGTSEGIPRVSCLTSPVKKCQVCQEAAQPGNRNRRLNTSILIRYAGPAGRTNILIDAGKFFYHSALRWFPHFGLRYLDALLITHSHADAIGGLDDVRDWTNNVQEFVPIYVTKRDLEVMEKTHYYLVDTSVTMPGTAVSKLQFNVITEEPFHVHGLKGYRSLGFRIGNVCYISDVSDIPEETYGLLKDCELLILDALRPDRSSTTHFGLPRALQEVRKICPERTLFTGMMHLMDHDRVNEDLAKLKEQEGLDIQLSYDGLCVPINI
ncbi:putative hydrolase C777.06c isoform X2 [Cryptomeria japonica]|uniref:putative hydrolase C777.06c isoform X2 n=1 Tax=Cryptomeria japonica TaxID=3369 RepID=UPI0027DA1D2B|nr:putative hydrolase C777.06c isoform X2 [Cryptomeria japonica]